MLEAAGFRCDQVIILPENREALTTETVTDENLDAWRINAAILIGEKLDYAPAAAADARRRMRRAAERALWGDTGAPGAAGESGDDEALRTMALKLLPMEYALVWAEEKYDPAMTEKTRAMVERIREAYIARIRDRFEKHFEQTEIIRGITRSFQGEMGECFADFSGITLVLDLTGDDPDARRHALESWAASKAFRYVTSRAQMALKIEFDMLTSHPVGAQRINGVVSAMDVFFDLYDVKRRRPDVHITRKPAEPVVTTNNSSGCSAL